MASSPSADTQSQSTPGADTVNDPSHPQPPQPVDDLIRYPPFPTAPEGVHLVPFKDFRQAGIEIFSEDGVERDGRGVPTISLRVRHETDTCKTEATRNDGTHHVTGKKKKKGKKSAKPGDEQDEADDLTPPKVDYVQRAKDRKVERIRQFSLRRWYEVWADGEDLRGLKITYESSLSTTDRIHLAATDFRTGRPWPNVKTQVSYLWDQIRLFTGLLGQTPVWIRKDLEQESGSDISDDEDEFEAQNSRKPASADPKPIATFSDSDSEPLPEEEDEPIPQGEEAKLHRPPRNPLKRILPRTPYALYNVEPVLISSPDEIPPLLARATRAKAAHLAAFLFHPGPIIRTRILLSSHLRIEGLVYTPSFLRDLPRLMLFWTEYLLRTRALKEVERELRVVRDISRRAVDELIRTGVVCKRLPDRVGKGMKGFYGVRWRNADDLEKDEKIKRFEEALKAENMLFLDAKDLSLPDVIPDITPLPVVAEEHGIPFVTIDAQLPSLLKPDPTAFIEAVQEEQGVSSHSPVTPSTVLDGDVMADMSTSPAIPDEDSDFQPVEPASESTYPSFSIPIGESEPPIIPRWDDESKDPEAALASWLDPPTQQLFQLMGPTILPLKFEAGGPGDGLGPWTWPVQPGSQVDSITKAASAPIPLQTQKRAFVEKSMRRVKSIHLPGDLAPAEKVVAGYVSKGIESQIVERLARIVLEPWIDWDPEGKIEPAWSKPRVQRPEASKEVKDPQENGAEAEGDEQKEEPPVEHDAEKDDILLLVDPEVLETMFVGMGIAGTWVQLVRVPSSPLAPSSGPVRGRGGARGRGQGRGRGRGRGGATPGGQGETQQRKQLTWWYVEDVHMAIPSYWLLGEDVVVPDEELET